MPEVALSCEIKLLEVTSRDQASVHSELSVVRTYGSIRGVD